jgi:hypothetical protein
LFASPGEAVVHTTTVLLSLLVLGISAFAYRKAKGRRYFLLALGFLFLSVSQLEQFFESYYFNAFVYLPYLEVHFSHLFDLSMLVCFGAALLVR